MHNRNRAADNSRELNELMLFQFSGGHRIVRSAEVNGTRDNLALTAAGADGLIVHLVTGSSLVVRSPLGVDGVGERSAGTGNRGSVRDGERRGSDKGGESDSFERLESDHFRVCNQLKNGRPGWDNSSLPSRYPAYYEAIISTLLRIHDVYMNFS